MAKYNLRVPDDAWGLSMSDLKQISKICRGRFWVTNKKMVYHAHLAKFEVVDVGQFMICSKSRIAIREAKDMIEKWLRDKKLDMNVTFTFITK